jgi:hypothetical protein
LIFPSKQYISIIFITITIFITPSKQQFYQPSHTMSMFGVPTEAELESLIDWLAICVCSSPCSPQISLPFYKITTSN